jgi:ribonuclease P/MRP protein subunit POP1
VVDTSYFGIIELQGARVELLRVLQRITAGAFAGAKYESGAKSARVDVYHTDAYPLNLIGPAEVIWQPLEENKKGKGNGEKDADDRRLWIRFHPSIFDQLWQELKTAAIPRSDSSSTQRAVAQLQIRDLRGEIDSFELTGPKSGQVLKRILRVCNDETTEKKAFFDVLGHMQNAGVLAEGMVAGLKVYDPRLQ